MKKLVLFMPHNRYHTYNMSYIIPHLNNLNIDSIFLNADEKFGEGSLEEIKRLSLPYVEYTGNCLREIKPDLVLCMNDWRGVIKDLVNKANDIGIPSVGMVEGVQDFLDSQTEGMTSHSKRRPYQRCRFQFLSGDYDRKFINGNRALVIGVPRIEELIKEESNKPSNALVSINCNFTYGIYEDIALLWIDEVVSACDEVGVDYVITQHHADNTELEFYNTTCSSLHDVLRASSVHISRFSTSILESMALGTPVIYHNPHGEVVDTYRDPMGAYRITTDIAKLRDEITSLLESTEDYRQVCRSKLNYHVSMESIHSGERAALAINDILMEATPGNKGFIGASLANVARIITGDFYWNDIKNREL